MQEGALTCLLSLGRNSPRALKRRKSVKCLGMPRGERGRGGERKTRTSPPRGPLLLFLTSSVPEAGWGNRGYTEHSPPPGSRKLMRVVIAQGERTSLGPGRCERSRDWSLKPSPACCRQPQSPTLEPLSWQAMAPRGAHPQLLALGSVRKCRRLKNSSSSLGTSRFRYKTPWRGGQRKPVSDPAV